MQYPDIFPQERDVLAGPRGPFFMHEGALTLVAGIVAKQVVRGPFRFLCTPDLFGEGPAISPDV